LGRFYYFSLGDLRACVCRFLTGPLALKDSSSLLHKFDLLQPAVNRGQVGADFLFFGIRLKSTWLSIEYMRPSTVSCKAVSRRPQSHHPDPMWVNLVA